MMKKMANNFSMWVIFDGRLEYPMGAGCSERMAWFNAAYVYKTTDVSIDDLPISEMKKLGYFAHRVKVEIDEGA